MVATALGGRTLGKALVGLRVVATDGSPAGWRRSLLRTTIALGPWWVALVPIDGTWIVSCAWLFTLATTTDDRPRAPGIPRPRRRHGRRARLTRTGRAAARERLTIDAVLTTGITDGELFKGVHYSRLGATTQSLVMRTKSGTARLIEAQHGDGFGAPGCSGTALQRSKVG